MKEQDLVLKPIGTIESSLKNVKDAPCQGHLGSQEAWLAIDSSVADGLKNLRVGDKIIVLTWFHLADRSTLFVYPQDNRNNPLTSVFATRSADRPNPVGLHPVTILEIAANRLRVVPMEAIDGTPIVDIKPVI